jgi:succinate dehydrogenase flavin-adding protein (antitoxin of CptAB toxin-antitoxin module)
LQGPASELGKINKDNLPIDLSTKNYKLEKIPTDLQKVDFQSVLNLTDKELFDRLIDQQSETETEKTKLKALWRKLLESNSV